MTRPQISQSLSSVTSMGWNSSFSGLRNTRLPFLSIRLSVNSSPRRATTIAAVGARHGPVNDQQIAVENARSPHGIAGDSDVKSRGGVADEMLVEVEACLPGNRRQAKGIRRIRKRTPAAGPAGAGSSAAAMSALRCRAWPYP